MIGAPLAADAVASAAADPATGVDGASLLACSPADVGTSDCVTVTVDALCADSAPSVPHAAVTTTALAHAITPTNCSIVY